MKKSEVVDISRLPSPHRLRTLADWFDAEQSWRPSWFDDSEVQDDLRSWADYIESLTRK